MSSDDIPHIPPSQSMRRRRIFIAARFLTPIQPQPFSAQQLSGRIPYGYIEEQEEEQKNKVKALRRHDVSAIKARANIPFQSVRYHLHSSLEGVSLLEIEALDS
jgi:hypothetical protein